MKKMLYAVLWTVLMFGLGQTVYAQVDKGVTSSGKEVDCSTIDPTVDKTVNEHGKVVTSPRVTRNGKLITEECPTCDVDLSITDTVDCVSITLSASITSGDPTSAILKVYSDAAHTSQVGSDIIAVISGGKITAVASDLNCHTRYYFVLETTDALGICTFDWTDSTRDLTLEKVTTCTVSSALALSEGSDLSHEHLYAPGLIDSVYDHQGNRYAVVQIGEQCWLKENMRCTTAPPGGVTLVATNATHSDLQTPRYYYPTETRTDTVQNGHHYTPEEYVSVYGYLYNFPGFMAINSAPTDHDSYASPHRGICPMGWHIPTDAEWNTLEKAVADNSSAIVGTSSRGTGNPRLVAGCDWITIAGAAGKNRPGDYSYAERNISGFSALPAGNFYGGFVDIGKRAYFACATPVSGSTEHTILHAIFHSEQGFYRNNNNMRYAGRSVRCVRDLRAMMTSTVPDSLYICDGESESVTYTITHPSITGTGIAYKWYVDDVLQASATNTMTISYNAAGVHSVRCEVTKGTQSETGRMVTIVSTYALPTVSISGDFVVCRTTPVTLTATSGYTSYAWSSNVVSPSTVNTAQAVNAGTYTVTVTDANGCTNSASQEVTVNNPLVTSAVTISGDNSLCYNEGTTLTASATASTGATLTYQWYKNGIAISGATSNTLNTGNLTDASTTFKCEVKAEIDDCVSAASEASKVVTVNHPITGTVSVSADATTLCNGGSTTVRASVTGNTGTLSYQWYLGSSAISGATSNTYNVTNIAATGTYKCEVTATVNGCTATADDDVTIAVPTPTPGTISITTDPIIICYNSSAEIIATATGNVGTLSYQWYKNDALISGATSSTYTTGNLTATSTFKCVITATQNGCTSSATTASKEVVVNNPSVTSTVSITGDANVCTGTTTTLTANATASTGATLNYQWYKGSTAISGATSQSYTTEAINAATTYKCVVTAKIGDCTSAPKEASVTVGIIPITLSDVTITPTTATICSGATAQFTASATGSGTVTYQWKQASTEVATTAAFTTPALTENTTYTCYATSTYNGCTLTKSANASVVVIKPAVGTISLEGGTICYNTSKTLQAQATGNNGSLSYQWSTGGSNISDATSANYTTPNLTATTSYTVNVTATVTSPITCTATDSRTVTVTVAEPVYDTLEICACKLPHTFHYSGGTLTFTSAEMDSHSPRIDTLTKTYPIGACPDAGHFTVVLWDPDNVVSTTSCSGIVFPNHTVSTDEVVSGNNLSAVTYNGYTYKVVQIGNQCWLKENLRTKLKPDGTTPIVPAFGNSNATNTYYKFSGDITFHSGCKDETIDFAEYESRFGLMYNWFTAMNSNNPAYGLHDHQGICPDGWHIPDTTEFQSMANYVGIVGEWSNPNWGVGDQISTGQHGVRLATGCEWVSSTVPTSPGDYSASDRNSSGFSARPSGCWNNASGGYWYELGNWAFFWSSTRQQTGVTGGVAAYNFDLHPDWAGLSRDKNGDDQSIGRSIRCVRNEESVIGINSVTPGEEQATCSYQVAVAGQNGVCWSTSPNPTKDDAHADIASVAGTYNATLSPLAENTLYYVRAYVMVDGAPVYSNEVTVMALSAPMVTTLPVTAGTTTATLKGKVTNDGGYSNTTRGICWGTSANPTLSDNVLTDTGNGVGEYSLTATSLSAGVTYHCRAYATNDRGTTYGADVEFVVNTCTGTMSDTDTPPYTHTYPIGQLGSYCWMLRSMRSANLSDGTQVNYIIENVWNATAAVHTNTPTLYKTKSTRNNSGTGYIEFGIAHHDTYGYYYNYAAAKQICPTGWHLPTWTEWNDLEAWAISYFGCSGGAAQALASSDTWAYSGTSCHPGYNPSTTNNLSEFNAYPCGCVVNGMNNSFQQSVNFWVDAGDQGNWVFLNHNQVDLQKSTSGGGNQHGMSVRCVKDH